MDTKSNLEYNMEPLEYTAEERKRIRDYERKIMNSKKYNSNEER